MTPLDVDGPPDGYGGTFTDGGCGDVRVPAMDVLAEGFFPQLNMLEPGTDHPPLLHPVASNATPTATNAMAVQRQTDFFMAFATLRCDP